MGFLRRLFSKKPARTGFYTPPEKQPSQARLEAFWKDFEAGKRIGERLTPSRGRKVIAVTPTVLGTVRRFKSVAEAENYARKADTFLTTIKRANPKNFELLPIQFFGIKGKNLLERVYLAPTVSDFQLKEGRYINWFIERMKNKGISYKEANKASNKACDELGVIVKKHHLNIDTNATNVLVLDYDPKTRKILFGLIDVGGSIPEGHHAD